MAKSKPDTKAPAYPHYAKDWLSDYKVQRMSYRAIGVYINLLDHIWSGTATQFSIENNDNLLSRALRLSPAKWRKIKQEIQHPGDPCLIEENGLLISKKLRKIKQDMDLRRKQKQAAARKRWGSADAQGHAEDMQEGMQNDSRKDAEDMQKACLASSSASSSASSIASKEEGDGSSKSVSGVDEKTLPSFSKQELKQAEKLFMAAWQELHCKTWETPDEYLPTPFEKRDVAMTITPANLERYIAYAWYYHQEDAKVGIQPGMQVPLIDKFFKAAANYCSTLREDNELWQRAISWSREFLAESASPNGS